MKKLKNKLKFHHVFLLLLLIVVFYLSFPVIKIWSLNLVRVSPSESQQIASKISHPSIPQVLPTSSPSVSATSYIIIDNDTNKILLSNSPHQRIYPASITKLATALTALNIYPLDEIISIGSTYSEGKVMELISGEKITVKSLITSLLIYSANDAAHSLADHHPQGISGFINEMNLIASKNNLADTQFSNFDGIHQLNHYSSVFDLAQLGRLSIKNQFIRQTVKTVQTTVTDIDNTISHDLINTNELLGKLPEIEGLKTGWTPEAGGCFIALLNVNGHYLISVVAQSQDRFADTLSLLNWAKQSVVWQDY